MGRVLFSVLKAKPWVEFLALLPSSMPMYPPPDPQPQNSGGRIKQFTSKRVA